MRRRTLMMSASAAALAFADAAPAIAQTARALRLGYVLPRESSLGAGAKVFEAEVIRRTAGRYRIEQHPNAALGAEFQMLNALQQGTLDLGFVTAAPLPNFVLEVAVFGIPFIFDSAAHTHDVLDGPVGMAMLNKFRDQDLIALAWGEHGARQLTNSVRAVEAPDDIKGLRIGVPQSAVMMIGFEALRANVSAVTVPTMFNALQSGRLDGQDNPVATTLATRLWQVQKHLTLTNHIYDPAAIFMSPKVHATLSEQDREAFTEAAKLGAMASRRYAAESQASCVDMLAQAGMEVVRQIDRQQFRAAMEPAIAKFESLMTPGLVGWVQNAG